MATAYGYEFEEPNGYGYLHGSLLRRPASVRTGTPCWRSAPPAAPPPPAAPSLTAVHLA